MIHVDHLTLKYPSGKGIENVSFCVPEGTVMGYLGPNGAGKTTTIRCLLGFSSADGGSCTINGLDCRRQAPAIQRFLGYIPGEIAFIDGMTGIQFLDFMCQLRGTRDKTRMHSLLGLFELDPTGRIKKYSKGMKQKIGIVAAFMHDPTVFILDEPSSGLDPLMQNRFIQLILSEKARGKTILLSSHIFEEVEKTCDQISIIKDGAIVKQTDAQQLRQTQRTTYRLTLKRPQDVHKLSGFGGQCGEFVDGVGEITVQGQQVDAFIKQLATLELTALESKHQSLEALFLNLYGQEVQADEAGNTPR